MEEVVIPSRQGKEIKIQCHWMCKDNKTNKQTNKKTNSALF